MYRKNRRVAIGPIQTEYFVSYLRIRTVQEENANGELNIQNLALIFIIKA